MLLAENIRIALNGLKANRMRALLTMLGIIIGIASVIAIVSVGNSMTNGINESMSGMGVRNITLSLTQKDEENTSAGSFFMFGRSSPSSQDLITDDMLAEYRRIYGDYMRYMYMTENAGSLTVTNGTDSLSLPVTGISREYIPAIGKELAAGRLFTFRDETMKKKVCLVSSVLCGELFPMQDVIGMELTMNTGSTIHTFYVVGVYEDSVSSAESTAVYIPLSTAREIAGTADGYQSVTVVTEADADTEAFIDATERHFDRVYSRNKSYTVTASSMEEMVETMTEMLGTISLAISVIAGISLLVGGIGVMNIMLVSITERTREIGTRKALGATNGSIRLQFIVEAVVICMLGGIIGTGTGLIIGNVGSRLLGYSATVSPAVILAAVTFSMAIGVFFGYYPADKAAKMNPAEALRYE